MNVAWVALVLITQLVAGSVVWSWLYAAPSSGEEQDLGPWLSLPGALAAALVLGPAALAMLMLAYGVVGIPFGLGPVLAPWWVAAWWQRRRLARLLGTAARASSGSDRALCVLTLVAAAAVASISLRVPLHTSDAVHVYGTTARFFETERGPALDAMASTTTFGWHSRDYPPLLAFNEALVFLAAGDRRAALVKPLFVMPWAAWILGVWAIARRLRPRAAGYGVTLLFAAVPAAVPLAESGYADLFLVAGLLCLANEIRRQLSTPAASGDAWRLMAWAAALGLTKDEGVVAAVAVAVWLTLGVIRRTRPAHVLWPVGVLLLIVCTWPLLCALHAVGAGRLSSSAPLERLAALPDVVSHLLTGMALPVTAAGRLPALHVIAALVLATLGLGRRCPQAVGRRILCWEALLLGHAALYTGVILLNHIDPVWQVTVSGQRLAFHFTPWLLLLAVDGATALSTTAPREPRS